MTADFSNGTLYCSFCGEAQQDVDRLITGPNVNICNNCVKTCLDLLGEESSPKTNNDDGTTINNANANIALSSPEKIKLFLDNYIIVSRFIITIKD